MTVAARRPSRSSCLRCTITAASRPARLGTAARLLPSVPWQLAQFAAMSRPRFAYGPTSAAEAELIRPASTTVATAPDKSWNFGPPSILSPDELCIEYLWEAQSIVIRKSFTRSGLGVEATQSGDTYENGGRSGPRMNHDHPRRRNSYATGSTSLASS